MSKFSGVCDLFDHISMMKMYPVYPDNPHSPLTSDELECFNLFKEKTGGTIYQMFKLTLNEFNIWHELDIGSSEKFPVFGKLTAKEIPWTDNKKHRKIKYKYEYFGQTFNNLKDLNKRGYWTIKEIKFDTLLDLIPYYPYGVSLSAGSRVVINNNSCAEHGLNECRRWGRDYPMYDYYKKELQNHYIDVVKKYYTPKETDPYLIYLDELHELDKEIYKLKKLKETQSPIWDANSNWKLFELESKRDELYMKNTQPMN